MNYTKNLIFILLVIFLPLITNADNNVLNWAKKMGGTGYDEGWSITVDQSGNTYTTGSFVGTVDFDPSVGVFNLTSSGSNDVFISKLDSSGNFVWAKKMGGAGDDQVYFINNDSTNIYITGKFIGTADFDPGDGVTNLVSFGNYDVFVAKLDLSGNLTWAKQLGGTGWDWSYVVVVDQSGNVYTTGGFYAVADFDPGAGVSNLTPSGADDVFISKLDSSGNFVWAKKMGGTAGDWGSAISLDQGGNIYVTGGFSGTADFDPGAGITNLVATGGSDFFVSKLDSSGNFVWAKKMGGTGDEWGNGTVEFDSIGNVYTIGSFSGTADFDPGAGVSNLTSSGNIDIFISKIDSSGNFVWVKQIGGTGGDWGVMKITSGGEMYLSGAFYSTVDFDPGVGVSNLISSGSSDVFISKLDASGNFIWAKKIGGTGDDWGNSIALDSNNDIHIAGAFASTVDFDSGSWVSNLVSSGSNDIFVLKLGLDIFSPLISEFTIPSISASLTVPINSLVVSDNVGVTGYLITESNVAPLESDIGWSASLLTEYIFSTEGSKTLYSWAKDEEGNISTSLSAITIVDLNNPGITLLGKATTSIYINKNYVDQGATASDSTDGDISGDIVIVNNVDTENLGTYTVTYNVSDSAGNQAVEVVRTVRVIRRPSGSSIVPSIINLPKTESLVLSPAPLEEKTISAPTPLPKIIITKLLKSKTTSSEVKDLQVYLNTHGYPVSISGPGSSGKETNYFGEKTKSAVMLFQKSNGLIPDGIVGPKTSSLMK